MKEKSGKKKLSQAELEKCEKERAEMRKSVVVKRKVTLSGSSKTLSTALEDLERKVIDAEKSAEELANGANNLKPKEFHQRTNMVEANAVATRAELAEVHRKVKNVRAEAAEMAELMELMRPEIVSLVPRVEGYAARLKKVATMAVNARQLAMRKNFDKYEALRLEVAAKLRACIEGMGGKAVDLFQVITKDQKDTLTRDDIRNFLQQSSCDLELEKLDKTLEDTIAAGRPIDASDPDKQTPVVSNDGQKAKAPPPMPGGTGTRIGREDFMRIIRVYCKVVKDIALSDNLMLEQSEQIRRMEIGEVMEVYQGPVLERVAGVYRVHGRALKDGVVGWVTISGNRGTTFLVPGGNVFRVLKPCALSSDMADVSGTRMLRMLSEAEVLEVLEWQRTARLGVTRIRARAQTDGAIGWATTVGTGGIVYLEAM